jgi:hypothetical protein
MIIDQNHQKTNWKRVAKARKALAACVGEMVGHVKDFTIKLIEHFSSKRSRNLNDEEHELRNQALRIQNARAYVALAKECGFEESGLRELAKTVDYWGAKCDEYEEGCPACKAWAIFESTLICPTDDQV